MPADKPFISICIPAYKRAEYLRQLLGSIAIQSFKDFEVIITDDSNDDSVQEVISQFSGKFQTRYFKNETALGSPENWNAAVKQARGSWIKLMHDDDWFSNAESLKVFYFFITQHPGKDFFFSAYHNYSGKNKIATIIASRSGLKILSKWPPALLANNIIGPPSATIYKSENILYDKRLKWLVDMDFYIHFLKGRNAVYIDQPLVNIGISEEQVTQSSFRNPLVEIPEHLIVLNKLGVKILRNLLVYDAFWRLFRNLKIRTAGDLEKYNINNEKLPAEIMRMVKHISRYPVKMLSVGLISKLCMLVSYCMNPVDSGKK
ncbi:MAG: glycosyl transferase family 2 [Chitinophagaceae bacterium]|nr:glycosyl transferase family 2 [Chitinophagaceae bacterium]